MISIRMNHVPDDKAVGTLTDRWIISPVTFHSSSGHSFSTVIPDTRAEPNVLLSSENSSPWQLKGEYRSTLPQSTLVPHQR